MIVRLCPCTWTFSYSDYRLPLVLTGTSAYVLGGRECKEEMVLAASLPPPPPPPIPLQVPSPPPPSTQVPSPPPLPTQAPYPYPYRGPLLYLVHQSQFE